MVTVPHEIEVKIGVIDLANVAFRLVTAGFRELRPRIFESNVLFDSSDGLLRSRDHLLRLRSVGQHTILTWKGKTVPGPHKSRPEVECCIEGAQQLTHIFRELGFEPGFRYEKYRTEYQREPDGVVTLDETPIGAYLELEGAPEWIDGAAKLLGFTEADYIFESYGALYRDYCKAHGLTPANMVFVQG